MTRKLYGQWMLLIFVSFVRWVLIGSSIALYIYLEYLGNSWMTVLIVFLLWDIANMVLNACTQ